MSKYIKTLEQIEGIRKSCHEMAVIFDKLIPLVKPGLDIGDLESVACKLIAEVGGRPAFKGYKTHKSAVPFPSALCVSVNNEIVHGVAIPGRILYNGDIVGVDVGMELGGYYSDMARTLPVGEISPKAQKLLEVTERALYLGIDQMKAGNFSMSFRVFEELDGKQMILEFPSALDFFKNEVQKCKEVQSLPLSMNNSNEIKMHKNKEAQAQEIINAIEKIKQIQETQNKVISYFLNILKNINITDTETKVFFNAQYNSLIKQAEKGNFLNSFIFSYTIDNAPWEALHETSETGSPGIYPRQRYTLWPFL